MPAVASTTVTAPPNVLPDSVSVHTIVPAPELSVARPAHLPVSPSVVPVPVDIAVAVGVVGDTSLLQPAAMTASRIKHVAAPLANRVMIMSILAPTSGAFSFFEGQVAPVQMLLCDCAATHVPRRVVLTGGPGAGKTAVLELIRLFFCEHVKTLPEAAGIVFGGRFPRNQQVPVRQAAQRAIYHVQRELESTGDAENAAIVLCDRGTIDGSAYWIGAGDLFSSVGTTREAELARYETVIHLRTPSSPRAYNQDNPLRIESVEEAGAIDLRILDQWSGHPHRLIVPATLDFLSKASHVLALLRDEVPECCRHHVRRFLWDGEPATAAPSPTPETDA